MMACRRGGSQPSDGRPAAAGQGMTRDLDHRLDALYGAVDWTAASGVLHVAAIASESHRVIAIGPAAPASATDRFVLGAARARADAIVTTGAILRAEPELRHELSPDPEEDRAWQRWRRERLGRERPPWLVVLSASGAIPRSHPALEAARGGLVWTSGSGAERLGSRVGALEVVAAEPGNDGPAAAIRELRRGRGLSTVLVEAGPSTAKSLYEPDAAEAGVDELLLSCFEGVLVAAAVGPPFVAPDRLFARFADPVSEVRREEASGTWRFRRYRAPTAPG